MAKYSKDVKLRGIPVAFSRGMFQTRKQDDSDKEGYQITLLINKQTGEEARKQIGEIVLEAATAEWGEKAREWLKDGTIHSPLLDGDGPQGKNKQTGERYVGFAGCWFIRPSATTQRPPKAFDRYGKQVFEEADIPSGSIVNANVNAWTWTHPKTGKGVSINFSLVQCVKKAEGDEVLGGGGGPDPDKFLEKLEDAGDAPESTKTGAGASGLFE
jgi:hypothetical protein